MAQDNYGTPKAIFDALDAEFNFFFDICASDTNHKCFDYFTIDDDALTKQWAKETNHIIEGTYIWCNPPYSNITPWVRKAQESQINGVGVVMLIMADPSVNWFKEALQTASEIRFIMGRISFINDQGKAVTGNNKGSCVLVFDPHRIGTRHTTYVHRQDMIDKGVKRCS